MKKLGLILMAALMLAVLCSCGHTHDYKEEVTAPTCTENGYTTFTCECGDTYQGNGVPGGHKEEVLPGKDATCTEDGMSEGKKCSGCGGVFTAQKVIDAKGHQYGDWTVIKEATETETGSQEKVCSACGDKVTEVIPAKQDRGPFDIIYDLNVEGAVGGYQTIEQLGDAFLADFNKYGNTSATKQNFQSDSSTPVKVALANAEMLEKWNWLWVYMLAHLKAENVGATSVYITDTYAVLEKMIEGDTSAIGESANARTSIRSYIHGMLNASKGCGDVNPDFSKFSPDFSNAKVRENFMNYDLAVTLDKGAELLEPVRDGYKFAGWKNEGGQVVTTAAAHGTLIATWEKVAE